MTNKAYQLLEVSKLTDNKRHIGLYDTYEKAMKDKADCEKCNRKDLYEYAVYAVTGKELQQAQKEENSLEDLLDNAGDMGED